MSDWLTYVEFVERVRNCHLRGFSGLLAGVSDSRHAFQIGFERGRIILLTCRLRKGMEALRLIIAVERARIAEHSIAAIHAGRDDSIDTGAVLEALLAGIADDAAMLGGVDGITARGELEESLIPVPLDARLERAIEAAALNLFGPVGALLCEEQFEKPARDARSVIIGIAREVEASEADTRAFLQAVVGA